MAFTVLLAEQHDILRIGLRTLLLRNHHVTQIYEVTTKADLQAFLSTRTVDLLVVHQSLTDDLETLPQRRFILLISEFHISTFLNAYKYGAKAYLLENSPAQMLDALLDLPEDAFFIDPLITPYIIEYLSSDTRFVVSDELLTPREREIAHLLREGIDRREISEKLCISESTLKTHIKNIMRKRPKDVTS